ncbi:hypothetical protein [Microbacterium sp. P04]|uniref:hypothetical protein n=1 Tax=Microbacterium sp. P04 TaxID=3366947 RepID=UPI003747129B
MIKASNSSLYKSASVLTIVIAVAFIIFGVVTQNGAVVAVFAVFGLAGLTAWPRSSLPPEDRDRAGGS